jgi:hypothetical protein
LFFLVCDPCHCFLCFFVEVQDFFNSLTIDPSYLHPVEQQSTTQFSENSLSSIKLLLLYQKYLSLQSYQQLHTSSLDHKTRITSLSYYCYLSSLNPFVSSLFGLEQWLRDKMKEFAKQEAMKQVFLLWSQETGVNSIGRSYYMKSLLRKGLERWMECRIKNKIKRKNYLETFMMKRISTSSSSSASSFNSSVPTMRSIIRNFSPSLSHRGGGRSSTATKNDSRKKLMFTAPQKPVGHDTDTSFYYDEFYDPSLLKGRTEGRSNFFASSPPALPNRSNSPLRVSGKKESVKEDQLTKNYSTLFSIRELLQNSQYHYRTLVKDKSYSLFPSAAARSGVRGYDEEGEMVESASSSTTFPVSFQLKGKDIGSLHASDYLYAQDLIALMFHFRRLYRRTLLFSRFSHISSQHSLLCQKSTFQLWYSYYERRRERTSSFEPFISSIFTKKLEKLKKEAFYQLLNNISIKKRQKLYFENLRKRLLSKKIFLIAANMIARPWYLRCFLYWKEKWEESSITEERNDKIEDFYYSFKRKKALLVWNKRSEKRKEERTRSLLLTKDDKILQSLSSLYDNIGSSTSFSSPSKRLRKKAPFSSPSSSLVSPSSIAVNRRNKQDTMVERDSHELMVVDYPNSLVKYALHLSYLKRYLLRWKRRSLSRKVIYSSFMELKFHYIFKHFVHNPSGTSTASSSSSFTSLAERREKETVSALTLPLTSNEKGKYKKLLRVFSTSVFSRQKEYSHYSHHEEANEEGLLSGKKEKQLYLAVNHYFHVKEGSDSSEKGYIRGGAGAPVSFEEEEEAIIGNENGIRSISQKRLLMFTSSLLTSSNLLFPHSESSSSSSSLTITAMMKHFQLYLSHNYPRLYKYYYNPNYEQYLTDVIEKKQRMRTADLRSSAKEADEDEDAERAGKSSRSRGEKRKTGISSSSSNPMEQYLAMVSQPSRLDGGTGSGAVSSSLSNGGANFLSHPISLFSIYLRKWKYYSFQRSRRKDKYDFLCKKRLFSLFLAWKELFSLVSSLKIFHRKRSFKRWLTYRKTCSRYTGDGKRIVLKNIFKKAIKRWKHYISSHYDHSERIHQSVYNRMMKQLTLPYDEVDVGRGRSGEGVEESEERNADYLRIKGRIEEKRRKMFSFIERKIQGHLQEIESKRTASNNSYSSLHRKNRATGERNERVEKLLLFLLNKRIFGNVASSSSSSVRGDEEVIAVAGGEEKKDDQHYREKARKWLNDTYSLPYSVDRGATTSHASTVVSAAVHHPVSASSISAKQVKDLLLSFVCQYSLLSYSLDLCLSFLSSQRFSQQCQKRVSFFLKNHALSSLQRYSHLRIAFTSVRLSSIIKKTFLYWKSIYICQHLCQRNLRLTAFHLWRLKYIDRIYYRVYSKLVGERYIYVFQHFQQLKRMEDERIKVLEKKYQNNLLKKAWLNYTLTYNITIFYKRKLICQTLQRYHCCMLPMKRIRIIEEKLLSSFVLLKSFTFLLKNIFLQKKYLSLLEKMGSFYFLYSRRFMYFHFLLMTIREKRRRKNGIPLSDEDERERKEQQTMKREQMKEKLISDVLLWKNKQYSRSQRIYWKTQPLNHPNKRSIVKIQKLQFLKSQYFEKVYSYDPFYYASHSKITEIIFLLKKNAYFRQHYLSSLVALPASPINYRREELIKIQEEEKQRKLENKLKRTKSDLTQQQLDIELFSPLSRKPGNFSSHSLSFSFGNAFVPSASSSSPTMNFTSSFVPDVTLPSSKLQRNLSFSDSHFKKPPSISRKDSSASLGQKKSSFAKAKGVSNQRTSINDVVEEEVDILSDELFANSSFLQQQPQQRSHPLSPAKSNYQRSPSSSSLVPSKQSFSQKASSFSSVTGHAGGNVGGQVEEEDGDDEVIRNYSASLSSPPATTPAPSSSVSRRSEKNQQLNSNRGSSSPSTKTNRSNSNLKKEEAEKRNPHNESYFQTSSSSSSFSFPSPSLSNNRKSFSPGNRVVESDSEEEEEVEEVIDENDLNLMDNHNPITIPSVTSPYLRLQTSVDDMILRDLGKDDDDDDDGGGGDGDYDDDFDEGDTEFNPPDGKKDKEENLNVIIPTPSISSSKPVTPAPSISLKQKSSSFIHQKQELVDEEEEKEIDEMVEDPVIIPQRGSSTLPLTAASLSSAKSSSLSKSDKKLSRRDLLIDTSFQHFMTMKQEESKTENNNSSGNPSSSHSSSRRPIHLPSSSSPSFSSSKKQQNHKESSTITPPLTNRSKKSLTFDEKPPTIHHSRSHDISPSLLNERFISLPPAPPSSSSAASSLRNSNKYSQKKSRDEVEEQSVSRSISRPLTLLELSEKRTSPGPYSAGYSSLTASRFPSSYSSSRRGGDGDDERSTYSYQVTSLPSKHLSSAGSFRSSAGSHGGKKPLSRFSSEKNLSSFGSGMKKKEDDIENKSIHRLSLSPRSSRPPPLTIPPLTSASSFRIDNLSPKSALTDDNYDFPAVSMDDHDYEEQDNERDAYLSFEQLQSYLSFKKHQSKQSVRKNLHLLKKLKDEPLATVTATTVAAGIASAREEVTKKEERASFLLQQKFLFTKLFRHYYYSKQLPIMIHSSYFIPKQLSTVLSHWKKYLHSRYRSKQITKKKVLQYYFYDFINRINRKKSSNFLLFNFTPSFHLIVMLKTFLKRWRKGILRRNVQKKESMKKAIYFHFKRRYVMTMLKWKSIIDLEGMRRKRKGGIEWDNDTITTNETIQKLDFSLRDTAAAGSSGSSMVKKMMKKKEIVENAELKEMQKAMIKEEMKKKKENQIYSSFLKQTNDASKLRKKSRVDADADTSEEEVMEFTSREQSRFSGSHSKNARTDPEASLLLSASTIAKKAKSLMKQKTIN